MSAGAPPVHPFAVLVVTPEATRIEVERAGQRLLAQLEIGAASALHYRDGGEERTRTVDLVRAALTILRDPDQRLAAELVALADPVRPGAPGAGVALWDALGIGNARPVR